MRISDLKQKSREELAVILREQKARADELRFLVHQNKLKNFHEIGIVKKDIARILTLLKT